MPRSGKQYRIAASGYVAEIASVGASLRTLTFDGRDLVVPFDADEVRPAYRGATLAPWPNRIVDGAYSFAGATHQLPLTEPERHQALHGLVVWSDFTERVVEDDRVVLATTIVPQAGYPFAVEVEVEYRVDEHGLTQRVTGRNVGSDAAPWGAGPHPYLVAGPSIPTPPSNRRFAPAGASAERGPRSGTQKVDDWTLLLPAAEVLTVTDDRLSPIALEPVDAHPQWDFRVARPIGDTFIDHAFTALEGADGHVSVELHASEGGVAITWDEGCPWVQVHTADTPAVPATHRLGLAVEPMTCPPDAFNSGTDLVVLQPGAEHAVSWRIHAL
ncbi:galactose mutarotase [Microbacterium bovistercoris]|uniref:Galactose mutarotase n=1 Tax=Microbacterium bovistercoris TaxID=2293570 RepID=A0A371NXQ0_9MICO|nr:aldose 1-epimerase family protein [Microbacterium bovistercoris]REJ07030.1 galactose mutarotase [Microbacterium bovistercoris]